MSTSPPKSSAIGAASSRGEFVLNNHLLLESIIKELPDLRDIAALTCVSKHVHFHVQHVFPLAAHTLSFSLTPQFSDATVLRLMDRYLAKNNRSLARKTISRDGKATVMVGSCAINAPFTGPWRNLQVVDLSGTDVTTTVVVALFAGTCGGLVPGLGTQSNRVFTKFVQRLEHDEFKGVGTRLLEDQGLRLKRLCVKNCHKVNVTQIINFLRKVLDVATRPERNRMTPVTGPAVTTHHVPERQQLLGLQEGDVNATLGPLPGTAEELEQYGLPCTSLRRLELYGINGLNIPANTYREGVYKSLASLTTVTGCLGLEIDVGFCQASHCARGVEENFEEGVAKGRSYKYPLPRLPHERIILGKDGRVFFIPRHCIPVSPEPGQPPRLPLPVLPNTQAFTQITQAIAQFQGANGTGFANLAQLAHQAVGISTATSVPITQVNQVITSMLNNSTMPINLMLQTLQGALATTTFPTYVPIPPDFRQQAASQSPCGKLRRIAIGDGPRGLSDCCQREIWLCTYCNSYFAAVCGGCSAKYDSEECVVDANSASNVPQALPPPAAMALTASNSPFAAGPSGVGATVAPPTTATSAT